MSAGSDSSSEGDTALTAGPKDTGIAESNGHANATSTTKTSKADAKDATPKQLDKALVGMSNGLKHLYSSKEDRKGRFQWQTAIPEDVGTPAEDAETLQWAIIVRHVKAFNDPSKVLSIHSIVIQSPPLKDLLKAVLKGYPGVTVGVNRLEIEGRFEPLIHRWTELKEAIAKLEREGDFTPLKVEETVEDKAEGGSVVETANASSVGQTDAKPEQGDAVVNGSTDDKVSAENAEAKIDKTTPGKTDDNKSTLTVQPLIAALDKSDSPDTIKLKHAKLLLDLLTREFQTLIDSSLQMKKEGVMTYEHLWTIFQPGSVIYCKQEGQDCLFRLISSRYGQDRDGNAIYSLSLQYVDFDGYKFGTQKNSVRIRAFAGTRPITSLAASPLAMHPNRDAIKANLLERGARIENLAGTYYAAYEGIGWRYDKQNNKAKYSIKGRIVVDTRGWNASNPNECIMVTALRSKEDPAALALAKTNASESYDSEDEGFAGGTYSGFEDYDSHDEGVPIDGHFSADDDSSQRPPLDAEQKMLCTPLLRAYALREKMWLNLYVNSVKEIQFNTRAFDSLVLPPSQKELILGFTATQQLYRNSFDDVIEGKGRGMIILLSGPPGVGKTLTAESIAEAMQTPLYCMSAGEVGNDSRYVEARLEAIFDMVTRWSAVLLIDEADIFLEERSLENLERNKLVSTFLRVLEYYEGIMFLTTNRVNTFDAAFESRIHISLNYKALTLDSRKQVWTNFLDQHNVSQQATREKGPARIVTSSGKKTGIAWCPAKVKTANISVDEKSNAEIDLSNDKRSTEPDPAKHDKSGLETDQSNESSKVGHTLPQATTNGISEAQSETNKKPEPSEQDTADHQARTQPHALSKSDISRLAQMSMNGRQIKNILKTAQLLASQKKEPLDYSHVTTVLEVTQHLHNSSQASERTRGAIFS